MPTFDHNAFLARLAEPGNQPHAAFEALKDLVVEQVGAKLFTVTTVEMGTMHSERLYSNMPDAYPVYGLKPYEENDWTDVVLRDKRTFVANTIGDIAKVFFDSELIQSLGCESCINVPLVVDGRVIGTLNCLHDAGYYTPDRIAAAEALKLAGTVCVLFNSTLKAEEAAHV